MQVEPPASNGVQETDSPKLGCQTIKPINEEAAPLSSSGKNVGLSIQIPTAAVVEKTSSGKDVFQSQRSQKASSTTKGFLHSLSSKNKEVHEGEGSSLLTSDSKEVSGSPIFANIISVFNWKRCTSLPVSQASTLSPSITMPTEGTCTEQNNSNKEGPPGIPRSSSAPARNVVIVRSVSFANHEKPIQTAPDADETTPIRMEDGDEEIPEEEAVCRICLVSLSEGGKTFKLECSCKGDLKLTHEECVLKWFSIKGNKKCDVCGQEVSNLPVNLLRVPSSVHRDDRRELNRRNLVPQTVSAWNDFVVLVLISSLSYFFILEQLLVGEMKTQAVMVSAPFAFTLGVLGSMFAIILALKEFIWTFAALELVLIALFLHVFYMIAHLNAVYAITLAAVLGFGVAVSLNTVCVCILACRQRRQNIEGLTE